MSAAIAKIIDVIPYLKLRASEEAELLGMDDDQHGEFSYDYVEVRRDFLAWSPHRGEPAQNGEVVIEPQHGIQEHASLAHSPSFHSEPVNPAEEKRAPSVADDTITPASASREGVNEKRD
jgi:Amt family ammonium transporter